MNQFSFEFDACAAPEPAVIAAPTPAPPPAAATAPATLSLDDMARRLEQDGNFRVLRRLVPIDDFGPAPPTAQGRRVIVLDTETTGLSHQVDKIIELAMLLVQVDVATGLPFGPVARFEGFEDPGMPIPDIAKEVTGISDDMVRGQRLDDEQVHALLAQADLVVAHNAGFDRPFVEARFPAAADKAWACSFADIDWKAQGAGSSKLGALAQDKGWFYDAHRALVDCHALLQVLVQPLVTDNAVTGLGRLFAAAAQPSVKLRAIGSPFESKDVLKARGYRWDADAKVWGCSLSDPALLDEELAWLKAHVYGRRHNAVVELESLDSRTRYARRPGTVSQRALAG